jgi:hypothetical protein
MHRPADPLTEVANMSREMRAFHSSNTLLCPRPVLRRAGLFVPPMHGGDGDLPLSSNTWAGREASVRRWRRLAVISAVALLLAAATAVVVQSVASTLAVTLPVTPEVDGLRAFVDPTPVDIMVSAGWDRVPWLVPAWRFQSDPTLWRRMRLWDWDTVPCSLREPGLLRMLDRYRPVLQGPAVWERLDAFDWDLVPLPIRTMAVLRMIDARVTQAGAERLAGRTARDISDTVAAIVMVESWFEHRAVNVNTNGEPDLGLAQASTGCRQRLARLHQKGEIAEMYTESDYFNPWKASQVAVIWYLRLLDQAAGDIRLAVRAYNRGMRAAVAGEGLEYLNNVERKRARFIRNQDAPPSWRFLYSVARFDPCPSHGACAPQANALASDAAGARETIFRTTAR